MDGLAMNFYGITEFPEDVFQAWETTTADYQKQYYASVQNSPITEFETSVTIQSLTLPARYRHLRGLQDDYVTVLYSQTMQYITIGEEIPPARVATVPFEGDVGRNAYVNLLQETGEGVLVDITTSSVVLTDATPRPTSAPVSVPSPVPAPIEEDESGIQSLDTGAIIGIAVGGGVCLIGLLLFFFFSSGDNDYEGTSEPPPSVSVKRGADEVSTLAPPQFGGAPASHESLAGYGDHRLVALLITEKCSSLALL